MGMVVQHNMTSMNANRNLGVSCGALAKSTEKLSSGYKINRAGDNAAGLAISEKMRGQIRGLNQASSNAEDGISMIQTAEGALTETHSILQRMRELAVQAASDTNTDDDRTQIQNEIDQLTQEVDRIATTTEFNTKKLLDGSRTGSVTAKDGKTSIEGTFGNSNVSASISGSMDKTSFTDVIRVEITKDFSAGEAITLGGKDFGFLEESTTFGNVNTARGDVTTSAQNAVSATGYGVGGAIVGGTVTAENIQAAADAYAKAYANANKNENDAEVKKAEDWLKSLYNTTDNSTALSNGSSVTVGANTYTAAAGNKIGDVATAAYTEALEAAKAQGVELIKIAEDNEVGAKLVGTAYDVQLAQGVSDATVTGYATVDYLANGKIVADVEDAVKAYVDAYVAADGDETASEVVKAKSTLSSMYNTNATGTVAAATTINGKTYAIGTSKSTIAKDGQDYTLTNAKKLADSKLALKDATQDNVTVNDLFGTGENKATFSIADKVSTDGKLDIKLTNKDGSITTITINNADKLKAGDVLTITSQKAVESKPAATGQDAFRLQVGANAGQEVALGINSMKAKDLDIVQTKAGKEGQALDVTSQDTASMAVNAYDMAIQKVSTERAKMGAMQNRLEHTIANLDTSAENLQSAESSLRDTDMAEEMTNYSKNNILMQAGQSMLAQANQSNQGVLSLLQ